MKEKGQAVVVSFRLPQEWYDLVKDEADQRRENIGDVFREGVMRYFRDKFFPPKTQSHEGVDIDNVIGGNGYTLQKMQLILRYFTPPSERAVSEVEKAIEEAKTKAGV